jgi:hypothetical protein
LALEQIGIWVREHPKIAALLREGGLFVIVSNVITVFKALALTVLPGMFAFLGSQDFGFPGIQLSLLGIPFKWYIIGYSSEAGGLAYFTAYMVAMVIGEVVNFFIQRRFVFRAEGYRTIGSGSIFSLKNAAAPMSQGQFGQYPVYAFTTEGIYALPVKEDGLLGVESFVSPDVPQALNKISYVDGAVVYPTDRGVRMLSGGDNATISEPLSGIGKTKISALPKFSEFFSLWGDEAFADVDYRNYLSACYSVHDAKNKRIIFFNEEDNLFHLVYYTNIALDNLHHLGRDILFDIVRSRNAVVAILVQCHCSIYSLEQ